MAKKRVTLPKDFDELLKVGDIEALKAVYDKCELLPMMENSVFILHFITRVYLTSLLSGSLSRALM